MSRTVGLLVLIGIILGGGVLVIVFGNAMASAADSLFAATPSETGEIEIVLDDFRFTPNVIRVKAGQEVRIRLRNVGHHTHEFMAGREVHVEEGITEPPQPDFFAGIQVKVTGTGMPMGFEGMEGMPMEEGMAMDKGMEMEAGMEEGARVVLEGAHAEGMGEMDAHGGAMIMLDPRQESTLVMTIPADKVGRWIFGCFQEEGLHYDDGMRGLLIVEK